MRNDPVKRRRAFQIRHELEVTTQQQTGSTVIQKLLQEVATVRAELYFSVAENRESFERMIQRPTSESA